ncbi:hypothetical protein B0H13DRAFT_1491662, partial [Mycena leptocephala]
DGGIVVFVVEVADIDFEGDESARGRGSKIAYCCAQPSPSSSFAVRWAGKEAVFKSLGVKSKG